MIPVFLQTKEPKMTNEQKTIAAELISRMLENYQRACYDADAGLDDAAMTGIATSAAAAIQAGCAIINAID